VEESKNSKKAAALSLFKEASVFQSMNRISSRRSHKGNGTSWTQNNETLAKEENSLLNSES
jgi:hypothetical protein